MLDEVKPVAMPQIEAARARLAGLSVVSPIVACDAAPAGKTVYLKLENLQAIGSFKSGRSATPSSQERRPN